MLVERESAMSKLSSFLSRNSYRPLEMSMSDPGSSSQSSSQSSRPRILLLTALPNISHLPTREAFHSMLSQFCQNYSSTSCPLIVIHSEAGSGGRAEENWMDRERGGREGALELLGREVKDGPWCQELRKAIQLNFVGRTVRADTGLDIVASRPSHRLS